MQEKLGRKYYSYFSFYCQGFIQMDAIRLVGHLTSVRYLLWCSVDCCPVEASRDEALAWLQINFIHEVRPGEQVSVSCGRSDVDGSTWFVQGIHPVSGAEAFAAAVGFRGQFNK
jgi:hypothetical protein